MSSNGLLSNIIAVDVADPAAAADITSHLSVGVALPILQKMGRFVAQTLRVLLTSLPADVVLQPAILNLPYHHPLQQLSGAPLAVNC